MRSGSTLAGSSLLQARTARCSASRSGKTSVAMDLDMGGGDRGCFGAARGNVRFAARARRHQFLGGHASGFESEDGVAMLQGAGSVRDNERSATAHEALHRLHDGGFGLPIKRAGRLVEDEDRRVLQE